MFANKWKTLKRLFYSIINVWSVRWQSPRLRKRGQGFKPEFKFDNMAGTRGREKLQKINEDKKLLSEISNLWIFFAAKFNNLSFGHEPDASNLSLPVQFLNQTNLFARTNNNNIYVLLLFRHSDKGRFNGRSKSNKEPIFFLSKVVSRWNKMARFLFQAHSKQKYFKPTGWVINQLG